MAHAFSLDDLLILMPNKMADHNNLEILIKIDLSNEETNFEAFQKFSEVFDTKHFKLGPGLEWLCQHSRAQDHPAWSTF